MIKSLLHTLSLLLLISVSCLAQDSTKKVSAVNNIAIPKVLELKDEYFFLPNRKFYIERIICNVQPKGFTSRTGLRGDAQALQFNDSIQHVVADYLRMSAAPVPEFTPIIIRIKDLQIEENRNFVKEQGRVKINMEFFIQSYEGEEPKMIKIFQTQAYHNYTKLFDVTSLHEIHLREIIKECMTNFNDERFDLSRFATNPKVYSGISKDNQ